jgi:hypothetical protein
LEDDMQEIKTAAAWALVAGLGLVFATSAQAALIDVQFGPTSVPLYSGDAVIGSAGNQWNDFQSSSGVARALATISGAASGVSLTYAAQGNYDVGGNTAFNGTPYFNLMRGFLYTQGRPITLTFSGLVAGGSYNLYVYGQSDGNSGNYGGVVTGNGPSQTAYQSTDSSFVLGRNDVEFVGVANGSGQLSVLDSIVGGRSQTMVNGLQLQTATAVPEPAASTLFGLGLVGLMTVKRRRIA